MKKVIAIALLLLAIIPAQPVYAAMEVSDEGLASPDFYVPETGKKVLPTVGGEYSDFYTVNSVFETIASMINMTSNVFIGFAVFFIVLAGLQYVLAQGDEEKIKQSHRSVMWAVGGIVLIMLSYAIVYVINTVFTK